MAYSLKSITFKGRQNKILLQNENGPCPLIACANALLLSAKINLPQSSIRNNVASIDDVVNMLASHALKQQNLERMIIPVTGTISTAGGDGTTTTTTGSGTFDGEGETIDGNNNNSDNNYEDNAATKAHHIDELLTLFPSLQHGMDVNPKFTLGPTGCEYTKGVDAFDLMGVDLVHGWLIDAHQDRDLAEIIGNKSYNELIDLIVTSKEAADVSDQLTKQIQELHENKCNNNNDTHNNNHIIERKDQDEDTQPTIVNTHNEKEQEIHRLHEELQKQNDIAAKGSVVEQFLHETSHQLTYVGLTELHGHVQEGHLCVFFRNNHFATLTKHEGILYLLVTDLGYAGVNEVMWEKLDDISGDTDLYDASFCKSRVQSIDPVTSGPNLTPEQLLAQRGQTDVDYQLALELSRNDHINTNRLAQEEDQLIAAATHLSLQTYNKSQNEDIATTLGENQIIHNDELKTNNTDNNASERLAYAMQMKINEERDREMAMKLQAELNQQATSGGTNVSDRHRLDQQQLQRRQATKESASSGCCIC